MNFWTQRPNPTRFNLFAYPEYHTEAQAGEVVATLSREPRAYVFLFLPFRLDNAFGAFLGARYRPVWSSPFAVLLAPKRAGETEQH